MNKCDETHPQTSLTLASSTSCNALETVVLRDQYSGRYLFQSLTAAPIDEVANCGGNELWRRWEAAVPTVSCAADVNRSRNDSQLPASTAPTNTPNLKNPRRNSCTVDSSISFPMSNTCRLRGGRRLDLILNWSSATKSLWSVPN